MQLPLGTNIENRHRGRGGKKDRNIDEHCAQPAALGTTSGWVQKNTQKRKKQVSEVRHQMARRLELDWKRKLTAPDRGQQFLARLDRTLGPAMLLRLETVHVHGQLRRSDHV